MAETGFAPISLRQVADRAGVNPAMIGYHFNDKDGLFRTLLDHGFQRLFASLPDQADLAQLVRSMTHSLTEMPWLGTLMMQSVYAGTGLRQQFETHHAPRLMAAYGAAVANVRTAASLPDLTDDRRLIVLLISTLVFPHLAAPMLTAVMGPQVLDPDGLATDVLRLFTPNGAPT